MSDDNLLETELNISEIISDSVSLYNRQQLFMIIAVIGILEKISPVC